MKKNLSKHFDPWSNMIVKLKQELIKKTELKGVRSLVLPELWIKIENVLDSIQEKILDDVQSIQSKRTIRR